MTKKKTEALTLRQYEENAHSTIANSTQDHLDRVLTPELLGVLRAFVRLSRTIDTYKKAAFYGRDIQSYPQPVESLDRKGLPFQLIHAALGMAGESGEVVELILEVLEGTKTYEEVQPLLKEELGDNLWYLTVGAKANDEEGGLEQVGVGNNEKLAARWGDKPDANDFQE